MSHFILYISNVKNRLLIYLTHVWRPECVHVHVLSKDSFGDLILFYRVGPQDCTLVVRHGQRVSLPAKPSHRPSFHTL